MFYYMSRKGFTYKTDRYTYLTFSDIRNVNKHIIPKSVEERFFRGTSIKWLW